MIRSFDAVNYLRIARDESAERCPIEFSTKYSSAEVEGFQQQWAYLETRSWLHDVLLDTEERRTFELEKKGEKDKAERITSIISDLSIIHHLSVTSEQHQLAKRVFADTL